MSYKSRDIPLEGYFKLLEKEYLCTVIRSEIYFLPNDLRHFEKVLEKKQAKILNISDKLGLANIFDDAYEFDIIHSEIVPPWGMPAFIYNERVRPDEVKKKYTFPYSGTLVEVMGEGKIGLTDYVDFDKKTVNVKVLLNGLTGTAITPFHYTLIRRFSVEESDRYYYYSGGTFHAKFRNGDVGKFMGYHHGENSIDLLFDGKVVTESVNHVRRVLNLSHTTI